MGGTSFGRGAASAVALALALGMAPLPGGGGVRPATAADQTPGAAPPGAVGSAATGRGMTVEEAVAIALTRNRDVIAAKMEIEAAELDVLAARVYPNPTLEYAVGNLVIGNANPQMGAVMTHPGVFGQSIQSVGIGEILDVWSKRAARTHAAERGVEQRRYLTEDALREVVHAVRSAFADVLRAQSERDMAREVAARHTETARLSQARFRAGDIAEAELRRIELEGLRYGNAVIDADLQLDLGRQRLATLLGLGPNGAALPAERLAEPAERITFDLPRLVAAALERRPDLKAAGAARAAGDARLAAAEREVYPDLTLGATYTHSSFTISGDNPNSLGLSLSLPLPLFDRNQANIGHARLDIRRAENDVLRLRLGVEADVTEAVRRGERARTLLAVFERPASNGSTGGVVTPSSAAPSPPVPAAPGAKAGAPVADPGGMLARADAALRVAEKSYRAGASSLLELLDAQRSYLDTRAQYVRALDDFRQAAIDVAHAAGE
jgi:cobalt-zinc-cadmium efflux system outer membrane protein